MYTGAEFDNETIPLGGDQLVRVRFDGAIGLRDGAHTPRERFEHFKPVVTEFFHVGQDFLEVIHIINYSTWV